MLLDPEQLEWLRSSLSFDDLFAFLKEAGLRFPDTDIVPTLVLAGRTGAGKSSLINALIGRNVLPVGVLPTTETPTEREMSDSGIPLRVLDMPGVGEAERHDERMRTLLAQADTAHLMLLAVPCPERSLAYETGLLAELQTRFAGRTPMPVLGAATKIDCASPVRDWDPARLDLAHPTTEKERNITDWMRYVTETLHVSESETVQALLPCANGSDCTDTANQYGIAELRRRIFRILPDAARNYFVRVIRDTELLDRRAEQIVRTYSAMAGAAAAQPVPVIPDAALIMPVQVAMLVRLTKLHGQELTTDLAVRLLGPLAARMAGRFALEQIIKVLPGIGSIAGTVVASGTTYALGMAFHTLLHDGHWNFDPVELKDEVLRWWNSMHGSDPEKSGRTASDSQTPDKRSVTGDPVIDVQGRSHRLSDR